MYYVFYLWQIREHIDISNSSTWFRHILYSTTLNLNNNKISQLQTLLFGKTYCYVLVKVCFTTLCFVNKVILSGKCRMREKNGRKDVTSLGFSENKTYWYHMFTPASCDLALTFTFSFSHTLVYISVNYLACVDGYSANFLAKYVVRETFSLFFPRLIDTL